MRIGSVVVLGAVLVTSCTPRRGVEVIGGTTAQCIDRFASFCPSSLCIAVRVLDARGAPVRGATVAAWEDDVTFEGGTAPRPLKAARTGSNGQVVLFLDHVTLPRGGVLVTADGRKQGQDFLISDAPVRTLPECFDFVLPPLPQG